MRMRGVTMRNTVDDLTERVQIVYYTKEKNQLGDVIDNAQQLRCQVWAKVYPVGAQTSKDGVERVNQVDYRITIRHRQDILPNDVVLWRGKRLEMIRPPYDAEAAHVWTVLECREVLADG
jgi:SPP1 family predicted phage head-tail adaptor